MPEQLRHKEFSVLERPRELVLICPSFRSHINFSRIVRLAGCAAIEKIITNGTGKVDPSIARAAVDHVHIERRRSLPPLLKSMTQQGYRIVGLEQTNNSVSIHQYTFTRRTALLIGNERLGIEPELLDLVDDVVEIPVYGPPHSYNVATATIMAVYEYCKQHPT